MTRFIYDNEDILLELDGSNNITARYTHGPGIDEPLILERSGASFFYHADGLGSITEITDSLGAVKQRYTYSSFGKIESQLDPNFIQPYTFTAREFDPETGLYFYRARYYDPSTGRFLSEDPFSLASLAMDHRPSSGSSPVNKLTLALQLPSLFHSQFGYVMNNPVNSQDPTGRGPIGVGICVAAELASLASTIQTLNSLERELDAIKQQIKQLENMCLSDAEKVDRLRELQAKAFQIARQKVQQQLLGGAIFGAIGIACVGLITLL